MRQMPPPRAFKTGLKAINNPWHEAELTGFDGEHLLTNASNCAGGTSHLSTRKLLINCVGLLEATKLVSCMAVMSVHTWSALWLHVRDIEDAFR